MILASSLLATAASAAAQTQSQQPDAPPPIRLERPRVPDKKEETPAITIPWWEARAERPGKLWLSDRWMTDGTFQRGTSASAAGFGPTWRLKGGVSYRAVGGIELSANIAGRRGYAMPAFMVEPLAKDGVLPDFGFAAASRGDLTFGSMPAPVQWDTEFRVEKKLKTGGPVDVTLVGSVFGATRTARVGVVLGF